MVKIAILLLLATSCTAFEDVRNIYREQANEIFKKQGSECVNVDEREQIRMPEFLDAHKGLNLTLSCKAMKEARHAVELLRAGQPSHVSHYWCQYSRYTYDPWDYIALTQDPAFYYMPMDKIRQTARLHPGTIYGCAVREYATIVGTFYTTVCIYERKAGEDRCFCN
ncbi:hypothetical protein Q1695_015812 [Nippostrongylus brasiliensis]|nr:hypothetical protein Q1695_015812 [Nippostrongylus brasiliensis]